MANPTIRLHALLLEERAVPAVLLVDDDRRQFPQAKYTSVQAAIDAAGPGDTIRIAAGTYTEQLTVPAKDAGLTLTAANDNSPVIRVPATLTGSKALLRINGAAAVTVRGLTLTGPGDVNFGVQVDNGGSARITNNVISTIRTNPISGTQTGYAVFVGGRTADGGTRGTATITDNVLKDYQKGGVIVANPGSSAVVTDNEILGSGATAVIAQNGVAVVNGAAATISDNVIRDHRYTGADVVATGIAVDTAGPVSIVGNTVVSNDVGVLANTTAGIQVKNNFVAASRFDGVSLTDTIGGTVSGNVLVFNGAAGLRIDGASAGNAIRGNIALFNGGPADVIDTTSGTGTRGTANNYGFNLFGRTQFGG